MNKILCGNEMDRMPDWAFKIMAFIFTVTDIFKSPDARLDPFNIQTGQTVIDWGCGTGRYIKSASYLVGEQGTVYAVDIHELAITSARRIIKKYKLANVYPKLANGLETDIPPGTADLIYALDMFHMVRDSGSFLQMLAGFIKPEGILILEDGHQPRSLTIQKVKNSRCWQITEETRTYLKCSPP